MIRERILVPLNDWREGDHRLKYLPEARRVLQGNDGAIYEYQLNRLQAIFRAAYEHVPYYRNTFASVGLDPNGSISAEVIARLPVLEKRDIGAYYEELKSRALSPKQVVETATGGTTASPMPLCVDRVAWAKRRAATLFFYSWFGYTLGQKIAYLWGAEQDFPRTPNLKSRLKNALIDRELYLPCSYLNDAILESYYERLLKFGEAHFQAYPTPLYIFASYLERKALNLRFKSVNVAAEYLYDHQRQKIESVFGQKIFNWYGARELGHIATECRMHRGMHINSYGVYLEVLKDGTTPVFDEEGDIVITDLHNVALPLVRYRIGDVGVLSNRPCDCGSSLPLLETVGGRYVDTFQKADGTRVPGVSFTNRIIQESRSIAQLQIVQEDYGRFRLNLVKGANFQPRDLEALKHKIETFMHERLEFEVAYVSHIEVEKSGKTRFCKSNLP